MVVGPRCQALDNGTDMSCAGLRSDAYRRRAGPCFQYCLEPGRSLAVGARLAGPREHRDSYEGHNRSQGWPGADSEKSSSFRRLTCGNTWRPLVLQGPLPSATATDHAPAAVALPGLGGVPSQDIFSLPGRGHQRNARNEQICCATGTRHIRELGTVPPGIAMTASKLPHSMR